MESLMKLSLTGAIGGVVALKLQPQPVLTTNIDPLILAGMFCMGGIVIGGLILLR